jgi:hypothetical protein
MSRHVSLTIYGVFSLPQVKRVPKTPGHVGDTPPAVSCAMCPRAGGSIDPPADT